MELRLALVAVLPAALGCGLLCAWAWWWRGPGPLRAALTALAPAVGYAAGHLQGALTVPFPPRESTHKLFYVALAAGLLGAAEERLPAVVRRALRALACAAAPWWLLSRLLARQDAATSVLALVGLGGGLLLLWSGADALGRRRPGPALPATFAACASAASFALLAAGSFTFALYCASLAACAGAAAVVAWRAPSFRPGGACATLALLLGALALAGQRLTSALPAASAALLALAPLAAWAIELPPLRRAGPRAAAAVALAASLVPALAGLALALANAPEPYDAGY